MRRLRPTTLRGRLTAVSVIGVALTLAVLLVVFNLVLGVILQDDADNLLRARVSTELATLDADNGRLQLGGAPASPADVQVWLYQNGHNVRSPVVRPATQRAADRLAGGPKRFVTVGESVRMYAVPARKAGLRGTVVVALPLTTYHRTENIAVGTSVGFGILVLILMAFGARLVTGAALRPVDRMTVQAASWSSEEDIDRRFALENPAAPEELRRLAATFDRLLDRVAASLRHEQQFTAELSHELRTPLARVVAEADLALRRERSPREYQEALAVIRASAEQLGGMFETLIAVTRTGAGARGTSTLQEAAERAVEASRHAAEREGMRIAVQNGVASVRVGVDADVVERILAPLVENACRYGRSEVDVELRGGGGSAVVLVRDDGPGVSAEEAEEIFEPGVRGGAAAGHGTGAGLGLALARRLARAAGGDVRAHPAAGREGGEFEVTLPLA
ncbi:MAG TPA: ATP-binding protein [Solirubrobacteraceae bacterium]|nr:ATP-binding protein [Solirubrobacteraceae bacterium]